MEKKQLNLSESEFHIDKEILCSLDSRRPESVRNDETDTSGMTFTTTFTWTIWG